MNLARPTSGGARGASALFAIGAVLALPTAAVAATYYVDPAGDDAAAGDQAAPWQTLQHAAEQVGPGDQVIVREGQYVGFQLTTSGTEAEPITFTAEPGVRIEGDNPHTPDGINVQDAAHIVIEGFTVERASRAGIRAHECEHVTVRYNVTDQNGIWGVLSSFCDDATIEGNETSRSGKEHGIYVGNTTARPTVIGNYVWGNNANGIHLNGDRHYGGRGLISEARVEGNVIFDNGSAGGSAINADGLQDSLIINNLVYDNAAAGISLYSIDGGDASTGNTVAHNTIVMPPGARPAIQLRDGSTDNVVVNNILIHEGGGPSLLVEPSSLSGLVADHNAGSAAYDLEDGSILGLDEWRERTGQGASSLQASADELFADAASGDFRLVDDSPALGAGGEGYLDVDTDLDGNPRENGSAPDLGAIAGGATEASAPGGGGGASSGGGQSDDAPDTGAADPLYAGGGCIEDDPGLPVGALLLVGLAWGMPRPRL
jgi:hypothetical protein